MNRCPQCQSRGCPPTACRFTGYQHTKASEQESARLQQVSTGLPPAAPVSDAPMGYEAAWIDGPLT